MMNSEEWIKNFLRKRSGYLKWSAEKLADHFKWDLRTTETVLQKLKGKTNSVKKEPLYVGNNTTRMFKRLYFDIEVSPNLLLSWNVGNKISISYDSIVNERAIICICYKWEHEKEVKALKWNNGDDKEMLKKFIHIINEADEVIGHNGDNYDIKWLRTRCIYHDIPAFPNYSSVDTLKLSRKGFRFNSNRLDYIGRFLGVGKKVDTGGFDLWKNIVLYNDKDSMKRMIRYCKGDVLLLERVHKRLDSYTEHRHHAAAFIGKERHHCPSCTSTKTKHSKTRVSASGALKHQLQCSDCGKYFTISDRVFSKINK